MNQIPSSEIFRLKESHRLTIPMNFRQVNIFVQDDPSLHPLTLPYGVLGILCDLLIRPVRHAKYVEASLRSNPNYSSEDLSFLDSSVFLKKVSSNWTGVEENALRQFKHFFATSILAGHFFTPLTSGGVSEESNTEPLSLILKAKAQEGVSLAQSQKGLAEILQFLRYGQEFVAAQGLPPALAGEPLSAV